MTQNEKRPYSITDVGFPKRNKKNNYGEKKNNQKAHEVRTTAVILTQPKPLEEILKSFHDCRDCKHCFRMFAFWHCELSPETPDDEIVMFKHHYITSCEKFKQKEK